MLQGCSIICFSLSVSVFLYTSNFGGRAQLATTSTFGSLRNQHTECGTFIAPCLIDGLVSHTSPIRRALEEIRLIFSWKDRSRGIKEASPKSNAKYRVFTKLLLESFSPKGTTSTPSRDRNAGLNSQSTQSTTCF